MVGVWPLGRKGGHWADPLPRSSWDPGEGGTLWMWLPWVGLVALEWVDHSQRGDVPMWGCQALSNVSPQPSPHPRMGG